MAHILITDVQCGYNGSAGTGVMQEPRAAPAEAGALPGLTWRHRYTGTVAETDNSWSVAQSRTSDVEWRAAEAGAKRQLPTTNRHGSSVVV